jgi:hypothetical protein
MPKSKPVTHVALIVDRSSSMSSIRQEAIDAFNDQLKTIQTSRTTTMLQLARFHS